MLMNNVSTAHLRSAAYMTIDPLYAADRIIPEPDINPDGAPWLAGEGEVECFRLQRLRQQVAAARLKVGYPGEFHEPAEQAWFRHHYAGGGTLRFRAVGHVVVRLDGKVVGCVDACDMEHVLTLPEADSASLLELEISASGAVPMLQVEAGVYATAGKGWTWSADRHSWQVPVAFPPTCSGLPPHQTVLQEHLLRPSGRNGDLLDFGREIYGYLSVRSRDCPVLGVGESPAEAQCQDINACEQPLSWSKGYSGEWITSCPVAFRYVRADKGLDVTDVSCQALVHPARYRGAFACSDEQLNRVWAGSAYTLRLCRREFLIDGVKRDRLPWVGDLAMSMMVNAYVFGDSEVIRHSLTALGRAGIHNCHLNGIVDYSLWWIIAHDIFQLYYCEPDFLKREWPRIKAALAELDARCDADGFLTVRDNDWLFIDWVEMEKITALQVLWYWAQTAAVRLAQRVGDTLESERRKTAGARLGEPLRIRLMGDKSRHAHFLSVMSGLTSSCAGNENLIPAGTPYMAGFDDLARFRSGDVAAAIDHIRGYWGGMLDCGATSFWEAYAPNIKGDDMWSFYGRPFGKSLCHAWSAGPAALLPLGLFGLEPLEDGWRRFAVNPQPGNLEWMAATVPTPYGEIEAVWENGKLSLRVPPGTTAVHK